MVLISSISLLIFCLVLSISEEGLLKSSIIIMVLLISLFSYVMFHFTYFEALLVVHTHLVFSSSWAEPWSETPLDGCFLWWNPSSLCCLGIPVSLRGGGES